MSNVDSGAVSVTPAPKKTPKEKQLTEGTVEGYPIGRDKKIVPPDQVEELAALGCNNREIAHFFGIEESNVSRHFAAFLEKGRARQKIKLRRAMMTNACQNMNASVQIFLAKNFLGMSDTGADSEENNPLPWTDE